MVLYCLTGIACRWAGSHTFSNAHQDILVRVLAEQRALEAGSTSTGAASTAAAEADSAEPSRGTEAASPAAVPKLDLAAGAQASVSGDTCDQYLSLISRRSPQMSTHHPVELPVSETIEKAVNLMAREVQNKLWKNRCE